MYTIFPPNFYQLLYKLHVFTNRDENSVGPDQVGSWLIWICSVLKKKDKTRLSMKVANIYQLLCTVDSQGSLKCPWPKCPGRNVQAETSMAAISVA